MLAASIGLAACWAPSAMASDGANPSTWQGQQEQTTQSRVFTSAPDAPARANSPRSSAAAQGAGGGLQWKPNRPGQLVSEATPATADRPSARLVQAVAPQIDPFEELSPRRPLEAARVEPIETAATPVDDSSALNQPVFDNPNNAPAAIEPFPTRLAQQPPDDFGGAADAAMRSVDQSGAIALAELRAHKLDQIKLDITVSGTPGSDIPEDFELPAPEYQPRMWAELPFLWHASELSHKPLYFEEEALERYGHTWGPISQPVISSAHFFATLPVLPYKMGLEPPHECIYALGHYRPGDCAPFMLHPIPISVRAAQFEAGAWVGGVAIIP